MFKSSSRYILKEVLGVRNGSSTGLTPSVLPLGLPPDRNPRSVIVNEEWNLGEFQDLNSFRFHLDSPLKQIFVGQFQKPILSYANVLPNDRYLRLIDRSNKILYSKKEDLSNFSKLGISEIEGGDGFQRTETAFIWEILSEDLSKSESQFSSKMYGVEPILKFGSEKIKQIYGQDLISGKIKATWCLSDEGSGSDTMGCTTTVSLDNTSKNPSYIVRGTKHMVLNPESSDLFIVFANIIHRSNIDDQFTAFVIPKSTSGITISSPDNKVGLKGLNTAFVHFNNVHVYEEHILGSVGKGRDVLISSTSGDARLYSAARASAAVRNFLNKVIRSGLATEQFGKPVLDSMNARSKISSKLFALESMIYLTAGIADVQLVSDFDLDALACKIYANETIEYCLRMSKEILGVNFMDASEPFDELARDLESFYIMEGTNDVQSLYLAIKGLEYGKENFDKTLPSLGVRSKSLLMKMLKLDTKWKTEQIFKLAMDVHPSLKNPAFVLEECMVNLWHRVLVDYQQSDTDLSDTDLLLISKCSVHILSMISSIARASRSYSDGHAHSKLEVMLCTAHIGESYYLIKQILENEFKADTWSPFVERRLDKDGALAFNHPIKEY